MTDDPIRWPEVRAAFDALTERPRAERQAELAAAKLTQQELAQLHSLLAEHDAQAAAAPAAHVGPPGLASGASGAGAADPAALLSMPAAHPLAGAAAHAGQRLGAWEIVRWLGEGGMGEVYEARRADGQYQARAAIKLLKRGMDSAAVLRRFATERQALARLSHPHIARLLDAGATAQGLPYFVMEHVQGRPIHEAALVVGLEQRLALFAQLADAVAHAHRHLLVHRDLKPSNVLVDGEGRVKLLDFGIAKALDPMEDAGVERGPGRGDDPGADGFITTLAGQRPYTPHYASPEQVRGEPVSTATDIYSLGVLLYQMLTGARPTGRAAKTAQDVARSVLEDTPTRPSQLSASEALDPQWVLTRKRLQGDLDNILLKALEKEPQRRYTSVDALAADVRAFVEGRPVSARPASAGYLAARFLRRNRWPAMVVALGLAGLIAGLAAALGRGQSLVALGVGGSALGLSLAMLQALRAEQARRRAVRRSEALVHLAREVVAEYGDAITHVPGGREHKARMMVNTITALEQALADGGDEPKLVAELGALHARLSQLRTVGEFNAKEDAGQTAIAAARACALLAQAESSGHAGATHLALWALALGDRARLAQHGHDFSAAHARLDEAEAVLDRSDQRHPGQVGTLQIRAAIISLRGSIYFGWDKPHLGDAQAALDCAAQAQALYRKGVDLARAAGRVPAVDDVFGLGTSVSTRALILARLQRRPEAAAAAREAISWRKEALVLEPHNRTVAGGLAADRNLLAGLSLELGDPAAALDASAPGWAALERLTAEDPGNASWITQRQWLAFHHGRALLALGRPEEAVPVLAVSAHWLAAMAAAGQAAPRQVVRLARTWLALLDAGAAPPLRPSADDLVGVQLLLRPLAQAAEPDAAAALAACELAWEQQQISSARNPPAS